MRQNRFQLKNRTPRFAPGIIAEALEFRRLLSALPNPTAHPVDSALPLGGSIPAGQASPPGYSPTQIKHAYGIDNISFNGVVGTGAGQTIAIVVANDNPNFVSSTDPNFNNSDLHKFDLAMGLADPPSFVKVDGNGGTSYPGPDFGWANEIALDVEWTHAIAPQANILLVESSSTGLFGLLQGAANTARATPGVSVVTMSFAVGEFFGENQYDQYLTTPAGHTGVTFVAASGDNGDPGGYPGFSPNVVAVGATALTLSSGNYGSETGHNTSGGGVSQYESKPAFQTGIVSMNGKRATPDVAFDGNPTTGVSVYDSYNGGASTPWYKIGGTSFSSPAWAALIAITNQGRATVGLGALDGPSQTLPRLYQLGAADFHDITTGTTVGATGASAHAGYDMVTGRGTPVADTLVPNLAGGNTVSGTIYNDLNGNALHDAGEPGVAGFTTFIDLYNSGTVKGTDPQAVSGSDGTYQFTDVPGGTFRFTQMTPAGWNLTTSPTNYTLTLGFGSTLTGKDIGYQSNGQAAKLVFLQQPSAAVITHDITPAITVAVEDANGNILTTDNSSVTLSLQSGTGPLNGSLSRTAVNGIATFNDISLAAADTDVLKATDGSLASATSGSFVVSTTPPAVATQLVFGQQPTTASIGTAMNPPISVYLEDAGGHIVSTDTSAVTLTLAAGSTTNAPTGTLTVNAVNGIARFTNVIFTSAGTASFTATDGALTPITSTPFTAQIVPLKLGFAQQPSPASIGSVISPPIVVNVEDYLGNAVPGDTSAVTLAITGGTATLGGTVTVNAVNGVATFSDITVSAAGTFTITATDTGLVSTASVPFSVTVPGTVVPTILRSTLGPSLIAGSKQHATVRVSDVSSTASVGLSPVTTQIYAVAGDGTFTLLGSVTRHLRLKAGKPFVVNVPISLLPATLNGTYSLKAQVIDPIGNPSTSPVTASVTIAPPFVALAETFTRLTLPPAVVAGSKSRAVATLKIINNGNIASTGMTTIGIYASPDGLMSDATLIASITRPISIRARGAVAVTVPLKTIPAPLNGNYTILAQVIDPKANITSVNSNKVVNIAAPFVALSATLSAPVPATRPAGRFTTVTLTLHNAGNIDSTGPATLSLGLSSNGTTELPGGTTLLRNYRILANKSLILHLRIAIPVGTLPGSYFPFVSFTQGANAVQPATAANLTVT